MLGCGAVGLVCLIIAIAKRSWKGAAWTIGGTGVAIGSLLGLVFLFSLAMDNSLHRPVPATEVIGTWQLTDWSVAMAKKSDPDPYRPSNETIYQIELRADGTCRYRSLLQMPTRYVDCPGTWKITPKIRQTDVSELDLSVLIDGSQRGFSLEFGEDKGALYLFSYWGDPDGVELLRYDRKPGISH